MHRVSAAFLISLLLLAACGGGSSGNGGGGGGGSTNLSVTLSANPSSCTVGTACVVTLTANVTAATNPASSGINVSGNMSSCTGGANPQAFSASGNTFTYACTLPSAAAANFTLGPVTATDAQSRNATSNSVSVSVRTSGGAVTVTSGTTTSGINITLPAPTASPKLNATMIGAAVPATSGSTSISLTNAPAVIHISQLPASGQMVVAILGDGMTTSATPPVSLITSVTLSGPNDITVGTVSPLTAGGGVGFRITLGSSTATGARTVFLKNAQGDITAYSGGLEILP